MPSKDPSYIIYKGTRITQGDKASMLPHGPFGNGDNSIEVQIIRFRKSNNAPNWSIGIASETPVSEWHDLDGMVPYGHGCWISGNELFKFFKFKGSIHPLTGKKVEIKDFKFRRRDLAGMQCRIIAQLPDGKDCFVEMTENVGGCSSDGLGKAGHCIVVPNKNIVEIVEADTREKTELDAESKPA